MRKECCAGTLLFQPAGEAHGEEFASAHSRTFNVEIAPQWLTRFEGLPIAFDRPCSCRRGLPTWILTRLYREFREQDALSGVIAEALTIELTVELLGRDDRQEERIQPRWLQRAVEYLRDNLGRPVTLTHLAVVASVHPTHLARTFRRWLGCTPGEYVRRQQVDYVRRALVNTDTSISEIAVAAGFFDQSHLSRVFKKHEGLTPARYRALAR